MIKTISQRAASAAPDDGDEAGDKKLRSTVQSLAKGFRVLEAFSSEHEELSLSQIAALARLDPGTTFRMLNTLVELGYVHRVPESRRFRLTLKVLDLGFHAIARRDLRSVVRPLLRTLVSDVNEAASFAVLQGPDVLYIERVRAGITRLGVDIRIGTTVPSTRTAIGLAMLAHLAPAEVTRVTGVDVQVQTPEIEAMRRTFDCVRRDRYVILESMLTEGLRVLAVPVLDADDYPLGAISVAAPSVRTSHAELLDTALQPTLLAAKDIAFAIQASGSVAVTAPST
ncbi:IclR family transcriptional regulator [Xanthomonas rydalmerensis]|uniref:IclR family transcriptional regulator n=1 Tax=Xanthomonas rydalmerensis TaxID=3046274 RepID=A0ABZ0JP11_9XANT|nr:IclR family transcriptional regulator [Xanthomonas sp. DM-2023]WOS41561.1 IclR family transcriptional regulator [Xanthomonas sp. DM-2023]WOS45746.1 IclR family transcriptional regulator [Xanthomonas sp. DM-2023]WOS49926.1 IclR family transcriptional regulator [Xanthomonas sp. DM-2023]WOS54105.1 IclR family transcriptional regulator [Xanthomonas sp. DM-2023]WOS58288.1 IclR family transcriptional regulator [Xanthomonas sp. DM-2023]